MKLTTKYMTNNDCYKAGRKIVPKHGKIGAFSKKENAEILLKK